ncbi:MAG: hypothetical protein ACMXYD_03415 [Candidatus Woesearchaeota archaeon]
MQVANNEALLNKHLKERYEQAIQQINKQAQTEAEALTKEYLMQAKTEETNMLTASKKQASEQSKKQIAIAQASANKEINAAIEELVAEVLVREENKIREEETNKTMQWLRTTVQEEVQKQQLSNAEYHEDTKKLLVQANTQELLIEYSLQDYLREQERRIIQQVQKEVKKCLKQ